MMARVCKQGKGGLVIAVRKGLIMNFLDVTSSLNKNILVARLTLSNQLAIRLILAYGPQETEMIEDREDFMLEVSIEIQKCLDCGDVPMLIGDLNAKLEKVGDAVVSTSPNGKILMSNIVEEYDLSVVNFTDKCTGKWTHVIRTTEEKSVLDYVIVPKFLLNAITEMIIDEDCLICPFTTHKNGQVNYSDHNAITAITAEINIQQAVKKAPEYRWKFEENSLKEIEKMTEVENFPRKPLSGDVQHDYDALMREINHVMSLTCKKQKRKTTSCHKVKGNYFHYYSWLSKYGAKGKGQRQVAKQYKKMIIEMSRDEEGKQRASRLSSTIESLTINGEFSPNEFWKVKKSVIKSTDQASSIMDPGGTELFGEGPIKEAYRGEFKARLEHRKIDPLLKSYEEKTNFLARSYVEMAARRKGPPISMEELDEVTKELKEGKCAGTDVIPPEFYKRMSTGMRLYILDVMNEIKDQLVFPSQWQETLIAIIFKNKGSRKYLKNYRGIFLTQIISKLYEKIHMKRVESVLEVSFFSPYAAVE